MKKLPLLIAALLFASLLCAGRAGAERYVVMTLNLVPEVCETIESLFFQRPEYVAYDPEKELTRPMRFQREMTPFLLRLSVNNLWPVYWGEQLRWNEFRDDYPAQYKKFIEAGLTYDKSYVVHKSSVALYGDYKGVRIYMLRHTGVIQGRKLPRLFIREDEGSNLDEVFNGLKASDMVRHSSAYSYPIVRSPGSVTVYKITAYEPDPKDKKKKSFRADPVCAYGLSPHYKAYDD